jgi:hypothetical protein
MKTMVLLVLAALVAFAETNTVPETAVVVSTETVTKTVTREPRLVVFMFSRETGDVSAEVSYETVTRVADNVVQQAPFKTVIMSWAQITNAIPAMTDALIQFRAAAAASMTNSP